MADPFTILGLPASFDLDGATLERRLRDLSKTLHPDRYVGSPAGERRAALDQAMRVNEAYRTLRDPVTRAEALIALRTGRSVNPEEQRVTLPPSFLMQVMDAREQLAEVRAQRDVGKLEELAEEFRAAERELLATLRAAFAKPDTTDLAETPLAQLRYYRRMLDEVNASLDELV